MSKIFIDTNILIYSLDKYEPARRDICRERLRFIKEHGIPVISTQILQEFYVVSRKKLKLDHLVAKRIMQSFENYEVVMIDPPLIREAADCCALHQISFWDALIVTSAEKAGCEKLWTEDLNAGQTIRGMRIENPLVDREETKRT